MVCVTGRQNEVPDQSIRVDQLFRLGIYCSQSSAALLFLSFFNAELSCCSFGLKRMILD